MEQYKRYMIFAWDEYDNVPPFDCIIDSTDDLDAAKEILKNNKYDQLGCIFDRIEGVMLE
ncbi:MAG: hypothetical protein ABFD76_14910 [Smithella sp.]